MERRQDELREYAMSECGSDAAWANFDINTGISHIKEVAGRVGTLEGAIPTVSDPNTTALVLREPYGVVVAIAPWYVVPLCPISQHLLIHSSGMLLIS